MNLGDQVTIGQQLFEVVDFNSIVARIFVPERHLLALRPGLVARVSTPASLGREYKGRVDRISPVVDASSGTVKVTVDIGGQPGLRPGMYVDVALVLDTRPDALLIPKKALVYDEEQMFVYRVDSDNIAHKLEVIPELVDRDHVLPAQGFSAGDLVIVAGQTGLKDGALVEIPSDKKVGEVDEIPAEVAEADTTA